VKCPPPLGGGEAVPGLEIADEVTLVVKAHCGHNLFDRQERPTHQMVRSLQSHVLDVARQREPGVYDEQAAQSRGREVHRPGQPIRSEISRRRHFDQLDHMRHPWITQRLLQNLNGSIPFQSGIVLKWMSVVAGSRFIRILIVTPAAWLLKFRVLFACAKTPQYTYGVI
jgi:hypothetical protein